MYKCFKGIPIVIDLLGFSELEIFLYHNYQFCFSFEPNFQAAGIRKPVSDICPAAAEEALELLQNKVISLEIELQSLTLKVNNTHWYYI